MIGYVTLGTADVQRAAAFYDAIAAEMGGSRMMEDDGFIAWGTGFEGGAISVIKPHDGKPATAGNGTMVALKAADSAQVDKLHAIALEKGGADEGAPGPRGDSGFYAAYFRDLDGNKLCAFITDHAAGG